MTNGKLIPVIGIGEVGPLRNVLYVQELVYDLVSESALDQSGKWRLTGGGVKTFYNKDTRDGIACGPIFIEAQHNKKDLYGVNPMHLNLPIAEYNYRAYDAMATKAEAFDLLHKTLEHLAYDRLVLWVR